MGLIWHLMPERQPQESMDIPQAPLRFGLPALLLGNLLLSFGPLLVRLADSGPIATAFWRVALAVPLLFLIARQVGDPARALTGKWVGLFFASGLFFAADLAAWHLAIPMTKLANSNLLGNSTSFLLPLWMFVSTRQWPSQRQGIALSLAVFGAVLLMGRSYEVSPDHLVGDLLCVLAGALYTVYLVLMARARDTMGPWPTLAWSTLMSVMPLLIAAVVMGEKLVPSDWRPVVALALGSQILGQGLMIYAIGRVAPLLFGITLLLQPVVSALIGWVRYDETLGPIDLLGAILIGLALLLVRQPDERSA
jgi:drug/metabolite transporter (DMT)-like permease